MLVIKSNTISVIKAFKPNLNGEIKFSLKFPNLLNLAQLVKALTFSCVTITKIELVLCLVILHNIGMLNLMDKMSRFVITFPKVLQILLKSP